MTYKLVAIDLDGTLLRGNHKISEYSKEILRRIDKLGVKVVIATGRSYSSARHKITDLNLDQPVVCYNGAMIRNGKNHEIIEHSSLDPAISRKLIEISRREDIHFHGFYNGEFLHEKVTESSKLYQDTSGLDGQVVNFDEYFDHEYTKGMFIADHEILLPIEKEVREMFLDKIYMAFSKPFFLEVMDVSASKANALDRIIKKEGIKREEVIAFGDGLNDAEMLKFAGKAIIMKNGVDSLKSLYENSKYTNDEDGVAKYLEKLFFD